jgi:hypothetical protein
MLNYAHFKSLIVHETNRWARTGYNSKENLDNINNIANYFERPFKHLYGSLLRKIGSGKDYITGSKNDDGSFFKNQINVNGHIIGGYSGGITLSSCMKFEGFNEYVEFATHRIKYDELDIVMYAYNNLLLAVDYRKVAIEYGRNTKFLNTRFDIKTLFEKNCIDGYWLYDPDKMMLIGSKNSGKITEKENNDYQKFMLRPHRGDSVVLVMLNDGMRPHLEKYIKSNKKAILKEMTEKHLTTQKYRAFCSSVKSTTEFVKAGKLPQRPVVYHSAVGDFFAVENGTDDELIQNYRKLLEQKLYKNSCDDLRATGCTIKKVYVDSSLKNKNLKKSNIITASARVGVMRKVAARKRKWSDSTGAMIKIDSKSTGTEHNSRAALKAPNILGSPLIQRKRSGMESLQSSTHT